MSDTSDNVLYLDDYRPPKLFDVHLHLYDTDDEDLINRGMTGIEVVEFTAELIKSLISDLIDEHPDVIDQMSNITPGDTSFSHYILGGKTLMLFAKITVTEH